MKKLLTIIIVFLIAVISYAQDEVSPSKWSIGVSITYPLESIYLVQINYKLNDKNEIFFGPCFQNFKHESFKVNAYTLLLGYRYYIWKGLNIEAEIYPAFNKIFSYITKSHFPGFEMWGELKLGYQFNLFDNKLFIQPAPGIGFGIFQSNKPPKFDDEIKYPIFTPQILVGIRL